METFTFILEGKFLFLSLISFSATFVWRVIYYTVLTCGQSGFLNKLLFPSFVFKCYLGAIWKGRGQAIAEK